MTAAPNLAVPSHIRAVLAKLPSRKELLSMIASAVQAPMTNVAAGINAILTGTARAVGALHEKKTKDEAAGAAS